MSETNAGVGPKLLPATIGQRTMRGFVLHEKGRASWSDVPVPPLGPYDALVRPTAVATCTTDVHLIATAGFPAAVGKPIGHEAVGIVKDVGDLVRDFHPGDRVIIPAGGTDWRTPHAQRGEAKYYQNTTPTSPPTLPRAASSPSSCGPSTRT